MSVILQSVASPAHAVSRSHSQQTALGMSTKPVSYAHMCTKYLLSQLCSYHCLNRMQPYKTCQLLVKQNKRHQLVTLNKPTDAEPDPAKKATHKLPVSKKQQVHAQTDAWLPHARAHTHTHTPHNRLTRRNRVSVTRVRTHVGCSFATASGG